jgi:hypothetical protein
MADLALVYRTQFILRAGLFVPPEVNRPVPTEDIKLQAF